MAVAAVDRQKRPRVDLLATPIDKAIAFGCNAPNPHNTQAWKFHASELETLFYVDEERLLPVTDPPARQGAKLPVRIPRLKISIAMIAEA
jgi:hypothetical protein